MFPLRTPPAAARDRPHRRPHDRRLPPALRAAAPAEALDAAESARVRDRPLALLEAALVAADEPLSLRRLAAVTGLGDTAAVKRLLGRLRELYDRDGSAFQVEELAGGYQLLTRAAYHPWLARLRRGRAEAKLSAAARETLTIVAYRQPVTRADVEAVRGVQCGEMLQQLMERGLVRIAGRDDSLGRPMLYGTTKKFLQAFGLRSLRDLPKAGGEGEGAG